MTTQNLIHTLSAIETTMASFGVEGVCIGGAPSSMHHGLPIRDLDIVILDPLSGDPDPFALASHIANHLGVVPEVFPEYEDDETGRIAWALKANINGYPVDFLYLRDRPTTAEEAAECLDFTVNGIWFVITDGRLHTKATQAFPSLWYDTPNRQLDPNLSPFRIQYIKQKFPQYRMELYTQGEVCAEA